MCTLKIYLGIEEENIYSSQIIFIFILARGIQKTLKVVWVDPRHEIEGRDNINLLLVIKRKRPCCSVWFPNSNLHASRSLCFSNLTSHCDPLGMQSLQQWLQKPLHLFTLFLSSALSSCHNCTVSRNGPLNICQSTLECNLACGSYFLWKTLERVEQIYLEVLWGVHNCTCQSICISCDAFKM